MPRDDWARAKAEQQARKAGYAKQPKPAGRCHVKPSRFMIPAGTVCQVASPENPSVFVDHRTTVRLLLDRYRNRRGDKYVFVVRGWLVRVNAADVHEARP